MAVSLKENKKQFSYSKKFYQEAKDTADIEDGLPTDEMLDRIAEEIGYDFGKYDREQLREGVKHEADEHYDVTNGNSIIAAKIAFAHIREIPDYYTRLEAMEQEAEENKEEPDGEQPEE